MLNLFQMYVPQIVDIAHEIWKRVCVWEEELAAFLRLGCSVPASSSARLSESMCMEEPAACNRALCQLFMFRVVVCFPEFAVLCLFMFMCAGRGARRPFQYSCSQVNMFAFVRVCHVVSFV